MCALERQRDRHLVVSLVFVQVEEPRMKYNLIFLLLDVGLLLGYGFVLGWTLLRRIFSPRRTGNHNA